ncbi:helix-turn-helix domain-containing protein [Lactobacillus porci]|uniref:helix-turn-helix domain-containing protein n=1 Tax=Lactobacillus porci TaxID=2012477 RepID=UPI003992D2B8
MNTMTLRLKELREQRAWTKTETAKRLNVGTSTYSNWEYGLREPDIERLSQLADLYGVTVDYLLGRSDQLPSVDLAQSKITFMYEGEKVPESEMKIVRRLLNSKND